MQSLVGRVLGVAVAVASFIAVAARSARWAWASLLAVLVVAIIAG